MATHAQRAPASSATRRRVLRAGMTALFVGLALVALGNVLWPARPVQLAEGDVLHSALEGFTATVLHAGADIDLELRMQPHAEGPPLHVHTGFDETFVVHSGTASLALEGQTITLHPGDRYTVPRGTAHAPFNATPEEVVLHTTLPAAFAGGLANFYRASDAIGDLDSPRVLLALAAEGQGFDTWSPTAPLGVQQAMRWVLGPLGRGWLS